VLTRVHDQWADNELVCAAHQVDVAPQATVAMTRRAESLSNRFHGALQLWELYCLRTRGEVPAFPIPTANRIGRYFAGKNWPRPRPPENIRLFDIAIVGLWPSGMVAGPSTL
jgi:hypothetical protein